MDVDVTAGDSLEEIVLQVSLFPCVWIFVLRSNHNETWKLTLLKVRWLHSQVSCLYLLLAIPKVHFTFFDLVLKFYIGVFSLCVSV